MARPLAHSDGYAGSSSALAGHTARGGFGTRGGFTKSQPVNHAGLGEEELLELERLQSENAQLHQLCGELEQALHEATQNTADADFEARLKEYETLLEEKTQTICALHQQLEEVQAAAAEKESCSAESGPGQTPTPSEAELLALSEELERERRQLQEDEQSLMEQMREMEVGMARERAEVARQRNDVQRLQSEVRHEIERLERNGALQSKIDNLKTRLQDATARRGAAPAQSAQSANAQPAASQATTPQSNKGTGIMGRLFGK